MSAVRNLCTRVIVLSEGKSVFDGDVTTGISNYFNLNQKAIEQQKIVEFSKGKSRVNVERITFLTSFEDASFEYISDFISIEFKINAEQFFAETFLGVFVEDVNDNMILVSSTDENEKDVLAKYESGQFILRVNLPGRILKPGKYYLSFSLRTKRDQIFHKVDRAASFVIIDNHTFRGMKNRYRTTALVAPEIKYEILP
jgi:hypothetical protein